MGLAKRRAHQDFEEGRWFLRGLKASVHLPLGYASFFEYVERVFGYKPQVTGERLRVAQALTELPLLSGMLERSEMNWSIVRELTRVCVRETEQEWIDAARGKRARQVERLVSGRKKGDRPKDKRKEKAKVHTVRFDVNGDTLALLRDAKSELIRKAGQHLSDDDVVRMLAAAVLGGPTDEGRASYQIAMTLCSSCGEGKQEGGGTAIAVAPEVVEQAFCDAQHIGPLGTVSGEAARATQTIPPAMRRQVLRRHKCQCAVPGCTNNVFLQIHHLDRWVEHGVHDPKRMLPLCLAHHRAEHDGRLIIEGDAEAGFVFYHGDRTPYGSTTAPESTMAWADAFAGMKNLGFKEGQAREALEAARPHVGPDADTETILRTALRQLRLDPRTKTYEVRRPTPPPRGDSAQAPPPRGESNQAAPPRGESEQAPPPRGESEQTPPPRGEPEQASPPRGESEQTPPPREAKPASPTDAPRRPPVDETPFREARRCLKSLGFRPEQAQRAIDTIRTRVDRRADVETIIRAALRELCPPSRACEPPILYEVRPSRSPQRVDETIAARVA